MKGGKHHVHFPFELYLQMMAPVMGYNVQPMMQVKNINADIFVSVKPDNLKILTRIYT